MKKLLLLFLFVVVGCQKPSTNPNEGWRGVIRLGIADACTFNMTTKIVPMKANVTTMLGKCGLRPTWRDVDLSNHPEWSTMDRLTYKGMSSFARTMAENEHMAIIYLCDYVKWRGRNCQGLAHYPSNLPSSRHGMWVIGNATKTTMAHELGHYLGLTHVDDYDVCKHADGTFNLSLMSYCSSRLPDGLSEEEVKTVRNWAISHPRTLVITTDSKPARALKAVYTNNVEPIE